MDWLSGEAHVKWKWRLDKEKLHCDHFRKQERVEEEGKEERGKVRDGTSRTRWKDGKQTWLSEDCLVKTKEWSHDNLSCE